LLRGVALTGGACYSKSNGGGVLSTPARFFRRARPAPLLRGVALTGGACYSKSNGGGVLSTPAKKNKGGA